MQQNVKSRVNICMKTNSNDRQRLSYFKPFELLKKIPFQARNRKQILFNLSITEIKRCTCETSIMECFRMVFCETWNLLESNKNHTL